MEAGALRTRRGEASQEGIVQIPNSQHRVQNTIGWRQRLARLQGSPVAFDLRAYDQPLAEINRLGDGRRAALRR